MSGYSRDSGGDNEGWDFNNQDEVLFLCYHIFQICFYLDMVVVVQVVIIIQDGEVVVVVEIIMTIAGILWTLFN